MNKKQQWLLGADALWCNSFQLPAFSFFVLSGDEKKTVFLALMRLASFFGMLLEVGGVFFLTYGLATAHSIVFLVSGILMKVFGSLIGAAAQNRSGVFWSLLLQEKLKALKTHDNEVKALLINHGVTESEVNALSSIGSDIYQTELISYQKMRLQNFLFPLSCGVGLLFCNELVLATAVIFLGFFSFPLGEMFYQQHTFRSESEMRAGRSSGFMRYLEKTYTQQQWMAFWVNFLSQVPLLLFGLRFVFVGGANALSAFYGITQGLLGLSGTLAFQKARVTSERSAKIAKHLIDALTSRLFIITPLRWGEHARIKNPLAKMSPFASGVVFQEFQTNNLQRIAPLNAALVSGGGAVLSAPSGLGKSQLLMAIVHLTEHEGDIYFVRDNVVRNAHEYTMDELKQKIFFQREDTVEKGARISDLFKSSFERCFSLLKEKQRATFGADLTELAWKMADNLLEVEIVHIRDSIPAIFPRGMYEALEELRAKRNQWVQVLLTGAEGNLAKKNIYPERIFATLSSGEKKRLLLVLAEVETDSTGVELVILDEPFAHLDAESVELQFKILKRFKTAQLIVTHQHNEKILASCANFQLIQL